MAALTLLDALHEGALIALLAVAFFLVYRLGGVLHIALGAPLVAGAYAAYALKGGLLGFGVGLAAAVILGAAIERLVYRPLRNRSSPPLGFFLASFGVLIAVQAALSIAFGPEVKLVASTIAFAGFGLTGVSPIRQATIICGAFVAVAVAYYMGRSQFGDRHRAVADNWSLSTIFGIPSERVALSSALLSSLIGGAAGIMLALDVGMTPTFGFTPLVGGIAAAVVGGRHLPGVILAAYGLALLSQATALVGASSWKDAVVYVALGAAVLYRAHKAEPAWL